MPAVLRFTRDKRGYEHFYLVDHAVNRRGKPQSRVLYWFRTPPNVKVGRDPFDDAVRHELERQYPDVEFDWTKILDTPIPSADVDRWRERRRAEKAEKAARRALQEHDVELTADFESGEGEAAPVEPESPPADTVVPDQPTSSPQPGDSARGRRRRRNRRGRSQEPAQPADAALSINATDTTAVDDAVSHEAATDVDAGGPEPSRSDEG